MARQHEWFIDLITLGEHPFEATLYTAPDGVPKDLIATESFGPFDSLRDVGGWALDRIRRHFAGGGR